MDDHEEREPSLDELSQAFAAAMGREMPSKQLDAVSQALPSAASAATADSQASQTRAADHCPISPKSIFEAILFVGHPRNEPIEAQHVASLLRGVQAEEIDELARELNQDYESQALPFTVQSVGTGYLLELRPEYEHLHNRFYGDVRQAKLSQLAVDVLAVVAYNQPITRQRLEKLLHETRSVQPVLNQMIRRDLLERRKSTETPKEHEYFTTDRFLDLFDLRDLGDLPRTEDPQ